LAERNSMWYHSRNLSLLGVFCRLGWQYRM